MSWAEFVLRSIGFKEEREFQMLMTREIAYQAHSMQYVFGKSKPPRKDKFWNIGEETVNNTNISDEQIEAFREAKRKYNENKSK